MRKIETKGKLYFENFDSVREFTTHLDNGKVGSEHYGEHSKMTGRRHNEWCGSDSWEQAQELVTFGYREGAQGLMSGKANVQTAGQMPRPTYRRSVVGSSPIVSRAIMGRPDAMRRRVKAPNVQRVVNIIYDCTVHCGIDTESMIEAGKNVLAMVRALEEDGVRVNLSVSFITEAYNRLFGMAVKVKDSAAQLNPTLAAYPMVHPSFLRRHFLRWLEVTEECNLSRLASSGGSPITCTMSGNEARNFVKGHGLLNDGDFYINYNEALGARSIEGMLQSMGIK